jgi:hypothetical protein
VGVVGAAAEGVAMAWGADGPRRWGCPGSTASVCWRGRGCEGGGPGLEGGCDCDVLLGCNGSIVAGKAIDAAGCTVCPGCRQPILLSQGWGLHCQISRA